MKARLYKIFSVLAVFFFCLTSFTASAANIANKTKIYFDATAYPDIQASVANSKRLQVLVGHDGWSEGFIMSKVNGYDNIYYYDMPKWDNCTKIAFLTTDNEKWKSQGEGVDGRVVHGYAYTGVYGLNNNISGNVLFECKDLIMKTSYTLKKPEYYVAGNGTTGNPWCDGKNWNATASKMDTNGKKTFSNVPAGTYKFKVVSNCWFGYEYYNAEGSNITCSNDETNIQFTTTSCADITISFASGKITVNVSYYPTTYYLTVSGTKKEMTLDKIKNEYYLKNILVKTTDVLKVQVESGCNNNEDYIGLESGSCGESSGSGITVSEEGYYDFYFKLSNNKLYVGVNPSNPTKYYIMGTFDNWTNGIEITDPNPGNANEVMLQCLEITDDNTQIKIYEKRLCEGTWINAVSDGSVVEKPSGDNNIVLNRGFYAFYYNFNDHKVYIGNATVSKAYLTGLEEDILMSKEGDQYVLKNIEVKSTDKVKVKLVYDCGNIEYVTLDGASCSTVKSTNEGLTFSKDGYYDFYFKSDKTIYVGANESNPANADKYYLMGVGDDWDNGILLEENTNNDGEYMLLNQLIAAEDEVKIVKKSLCADRVYYDAVKESPCSAKVTRGEDNNIKLPAGTYDFYFKESEGIYITPSLSEVKYYLLGIDGNWDAGVELTESDENDYEMVLTGQRISKEDDAIKIVKKTPCETVFYAEVKLSSPVPYTGGGDYAGAPNIVLEDGTYDFYLNKNTGKIYIGGVLDNAKVVHFDPKVEDGSNWGDDDADIAVHYRKSDADNGWVTAEKCNSYYFAQIPDGYTEYYWARMNPDRTENRWNQDGDGDAKPVWNQSSGITYNAQKTLTIMEKMEWYCYQTVYSGICGENYDDLDCEFPELTGDTLYVHINQFVDSDPCNYVFRSFEQAFAVLKNNTEICNTTTNFYGELREAEIELQKPVVMLVHYGPEPYRGTEKVGMSGGHIYDAPAIFFRNINKDGNGHTLIVRTADPHGNRAVIVHPVIRRSTNIVLDNLDIVSDSDLRDNAIDIDNGIGMDNLEGLGTDYNVVPLPSLLSNITVKNCFVESYGRNCVHVSGMGGLHFENNEFYTKYDFSINPSEAADVVDWGGTIKFINSSDIKFLRNNSEGTLATSFFIQGSQRILIMNNVFWNDNAVDFSQMGNRTVANVRLVTYGDAERKFPLQNIGIYYNTFFCKDNEVGEGLYHTFDFFRIGGYKQPVIDDASKRNFDPSTIRFQYNNCYSYDSDVRGNNRDVSNQYTFYLQGFGYDTNWCQCFRYNNFWSVYDEDPNSGEHNSSNFEVGIFCTGINETYNSFVNVSGQVCKNDPANPSALVVTGDGLNIGTRLVDDVSGLGAGDILSDRLNGGVARPSVVVDNTNESLSPSDHIYREPGTINLFTSPLVGSHTNEVLVSSLALTSSQVTLSLVPGDGYDASVTEFFHLTNVRGEPIDNLTTGDGGVLDNSQIFITFVRPNNVDYDVTYEVNLTILPTDASEEQLILRIPIRGHYISRLRPMPGSWTVGAFQQREAQPVNTIIWHGTTSTEWDDRSNWYKEDGTLLTCLDALTNDLKVIIPRMDSEAYVTPPNGITRYPVIPDVSTVDNFKARSGNAEGQWKGEQVNAGPESNGKIADKIYLEYGASIQGVEYLGGISAYTEVEQEFIARRKDWLLVGTVVRPWNKDEEGNIVEVDGLKTRTALSGDYYKWHLPQVYMHQAVATKNGDAIDVTWNKAFPDLDVPLPQDRAYAICIPDEYGPKFWTARRYNNEYGTNYNPEEPMRYTFTGRFQNEAALPNYGSLAGGVPVMLTNTYPANIDAVALANELKDTKAGTLMVYSYDDKSFYKVGNDSEGAVIQAQHSFALMPKNDMDFSIDPSWLLNTEVTHRSAEVELPFMRIEMRNDAKKNASNVYIDIDSNKEDVADLAIDAPKMFASENKYLPDLYVMRYDEKWAGVSIPNAAQPIPLGVRVNQKNQTFTISLLRTNMSCDVILDDRMTGKTYNLSNGERCHVNDLGKGVCEGRFFIYLSEQSNDYIPDDDLTTAIDPAQEQQDGIFIYGQGKQVVVSSTQHVELQQIKVMDMAGRYQVYSVSGRYVVLSLPVNDGIYVIQAIGDNASRTEKIQVK